MTFTDNLIRYDFILGDFISFNFILVLFIVKSINLQTCTFFGIVSLSVCCKFVRSKMAQ